ncbi:hypothetical protein K469DRAFT_703639 [Zopfia rhizophila CBS 207.26]|uniref:Uncharacterized protein n=1 Tax=Zopfia rhizophila CBS 207.26 TaxID=1314779 RepID=A0A6A6ECA5_9PEZI|nr:hypothetical protein K469DRAFT_703639 [Zopfia rhizophila CBS 207.26]
MIGMIVAAVVLGIKGSKKKNKKSSSASKSPGPKEEAQAAPTSTSSPSSIATPAASTIVEGSGMGSLPTDTASSTISTIYTTKIPSWTELPDQSLFPSDIFKPTASSSIDYAGPGYATKSIRTLVGRGPTIIPRVPSDQDQGVSSDAIAIGVVSACVAVLCVGILGTRWWYLRRRNQEKNRAKGTVWGKSIYHVER